MKNKLKGLDTLSDKSTNNIFKLLTFILVFVFFVGFNIINAQEKQPAGTITGLVISAEDNQPIPGANVIIKGTQIGTITNADGKFEIQASPEDVLQISFVGYLKEEVQVGTSNNINVSLTPDIAKLDEVVVIGYGVQQKKLVTGATTQVKGGELEKRNSTNALQALQGLASGINITSKSGQPGEDLRVTIRGAGTIGDAEPLYVVDGVVTGDIKYLNNSDIESIDVLKDAASAAIYGSRAANGVVLITTKQGKAGKTEISFDAYYGIQNVAKKAEMLNTKQYAVIMNEQELNSGGSTNSLPFDLNNLPAYTSSGVANTNWMDEMFVKNAVTQNYDIGATGGNDQGIYSFSLSYTGQEGIVGGPSLSNYDRYNGRFNSEKNLYKGNLKVGQHLIYSYVQKNGIQVGNQYSNSLRSAFNASPLLPMYDNYGNFFNTANNTILDQFGETYWYDAEANPYASMKINNQNLTIERKIVGDVYAEIKFFKTFRFRTSFGIDNLNKQYHSYKPIYELSIYDLSPASKIRQSMEQGFKLVTNNILTYDLFIGQHTINAMLGQSAESSTGTRIQGDNSDAVFNDLKHAYLDNATNQTYPNLNNQGSPYDEIKLLSYFGRVQYNYNETYLLNMTLRADGSSRFAPSNRWGYFPSISAGWVISKESFMQTTGSIINFLKLRASWGQNGNDKIPAFRYLAPISFNYATYNFGDVEGANTPGAYPRRLGNEKLKWETSEQTDLGFDAYLLNNNLSVTFDWYKKITKDWLIQAPVLSTAGAEAPFVNGGDVKNTGMELALNYYKYSGEFKYSIGINGSYNKNVVLDIPNEDGIIHGATNSLFANSGEFYRAETGHPIGYFWGYEMDGLFQTTSDVTNHTSVVDGTPVIIQPNAVPGDIRYVDQNGDGRLNDDDKIELGDPNPDFLFGLSASFEYKGFDFSLIASGVAGNQIVQSYRNQDKYNNYTTAILDRWNGRGTSNEIPRVTNANINYKYFSKVFIQNGDYLRIANVTLGYDITRVLKLGPVGQFRIYASVQNLYTFTKYDGMDPEVGFGLDNGDMDKFSKGIDLGYYPSPRIVLFGINVKF